MLEDLMRSAGSRLWTRHILQGPEVETADEHIRVRSRALVHGYCTVPHRRLDPRLVCSPRAAVDETAQ